MLRDEDQNNFGLLPGAPSCLQWEAQIADLAEGALSAEDEVLLRGHGAACPHCELLLQEAMAGRSWARMLHDEPPAVPSALLDRILSKTSQAAPPAAIAGGPQEFALATPGGMVMPSAPVFALRRQREARILMTAAMAFFSIAITVSMTGARLGSFHPAAVTASASRQFFDTKKQVVAFYDNLRLVREVEATVETMRRSPEEGAGKAKRPQKNGPSARHFIEPSPAAPLLASRNAAQERTRL